MRECSLFRQRHEHLAEALPDSIISQAQFRTVDPCLAPTFPTPYLTNLLNDF